MSEVEVAVYLDGANVYFPIRVELHSGYTKEDLDDIVRQLFPDWESYCVCAYQIGGKDDNS